MRSEPVSADPLGDAMARKKQRKPKALTPLSIYVGFLLTGLAAISYGILQYQRGEVFWANYQKQPVTPFLVIPVGAFLLVIGIVGAVSRLR